MIRLCWELLAELLRLSYSVLCSSSMRATGLDLTSWLGRKRLEKLGLAAPSPPRPSSAGRPSLNGCGGRRMCLHAL